MPGQIFLQKFTNFRLRLSVNSYKYNFCSKLNMDIGSKGKVLAVTDGKAIVQIDRRRVTVGVRDDVKVGKGDMVIIALGNIVAKA